MRNQVARAMYRTGMLDGLLRVRAALHLPVLTVLTYHHVQDPEDGSMFDPGVADATPEQFRRQMELVARYGTPVTLSEVIGFVRDGHPPPPNPVLVTFDDGYRSCLDVAVPILRRVGVPATFFIATNFVERRRLFWWERISVLLARARRGHVDVLSLNAPRITVEVSHPEAMTVLTRLIKDVPGIQIDELLMQLSTAAGAPWSEQEERAMADELILTWDGVRALAAAGMDVGSHTRSHRVLQTVPTEELDAELAGSRADLERELGTPCRAIAYPVGHSIRNRAAIYAAVREAGYDLGFTNASGVNLILPTGWRLRGLDPLDLGRLATGRDFSDAMFLGQLALPSLAYPARHSLA
ncbi:MAG: polysaccharide deacetylase family protein [Kofleriaceae bacterium]